MKTKKLTLKAQIKLLESDLQHTKESAKYWEDKYDITKEAFDAVNAHKERADGIAQSYKIERETVAVEELRNQVNFLQGLLRDTTLSPDKLSIIYKSQNQEITSSGYCNCDDCRRRRNNY